MLVATGGAAVAASAAVLLRALALAFQPSSGMFFRTKARQSVCPVSWLCHADRYPQLAPSAGSPFPQPAPESNLKLPDQNVPSMQANMTCIDWGLIRC